MNRLHFSLILGLVLCTLSVRAQAPADSAAVAAPAVPVSTQTDQKALNYKYTPSSKILSLQECIAIALSDNPSVKVADMEVQRVDYSKKETLAGLFPAIDFTGAYQRTIKLQTIRMNMGGQSTEIKMGSDNTWNFGFNASLPIIAPQLWKSIKISDTQILANLETARASRLDLINNVKKAYYSLLLAIASHQVLYENYQVSLLNAELYEKRFQAGTATEYDVLRSSVQVKNIEPDLLSAEISIRQCKLQLKVLMGISADFDFDPNVTLKDMQQDMYGYLLNRERGLQNNTDLRTLDLQTKMLKQTLDLRKYAWIPTLAATFNINWMSISNGNALKNQKFNPYSNVGLAISVPIFSGGSKYYAMKQAKVQYQEMAFQRENLVNALNMQMDVAMDNINKEAKQIETSAEGVRQAEKAHQIMQRSFEIGAATYLDLRDSELAETSAKLAYYQAIYNYLVSTSELDLLTGRDDLIQKVSEK